MDKLLPDEIVLEIPVQPGGVQMIVAGSGFFHIDHQG
jgi:redox-sensitive bicupin YhaK (pirin superfamily)